MRGKLIDWTVYLVKGSGDELEITPKCRIQQVIRAWHKRPDKPLASDPYRVRRIGNPSDEYEDLSEDERNEALQKTKSIWEYEGSQGEEPKVPRGPGIRDTRPSERGLLCLYAIGPQTCPPLPHPLVGLFISFPVDGSATPIQYRVNDVYRRLEEEGIWDE